MKVIITTVSQDIDSPPDARFGRGANFLLVDTETLEWEAYPNPAVGASGGAGVQAAQFMADKGVEAVVSGDFGPNAYQALTASGIRMYLIGSCQTASEAVERLVKGELSTK